MTQTYRLETESGQVVAPQVRVAASFSSRIMGLMFKPGLPEGEGLCIQKCGQIHMFFMRFPIDVAFVNGDGRVLHVLNGIRPWRISRIVFGSKAAIELPAGTLQAAGISKGGVLKLI